MKKNFIIVLVLVLVSILALYAVSPKKWEFYRFSEFLKGKFNGVSVSYEGVLSLSPDEKKIAGPSEEFYLSTLIGRDGEVFLGTGHSGKIYKIDKKGKIELYFKVPEIDVYCMVKDQEGNIYAGTSPNGKIYKITSKDNGNVFFNPPEKYIWDMIYSKSGILLAAVGEQGGIYEINQNGQGRSLLKADENHILCLFQPERGELFAGSGGKGHLYKILSKGKPEIIFESPFEEIRSIAKDQKGQIYVAAGGIVTKTSSTLFASQRKNENQSVNVTVKAKASQPQRILSVEKNQPGALYRISPEGQSKMLWNSSNELIYSLLWDNASDRLLFGTGRKGRIYSIDKKDKIALLLQQNSEQIYKLIPYGSRTYILANNPSFLSYLSNKRRSSGEYISQVLDAALLSSWGYMKWQSQLSRDTSLQFYTRSGNTSEPTKTWSEWSPPYTHAEGEKILSPKARYIQYKIIFKAMTGNGSPKVDKVSLFHQEINVEPGFLTLELLPPNVIYYKPPPQRDLIWGLSESLNKKEKTNSRAKNIISPEKKIRKGYQSIVWQAYDRNEDDLSYSIFIRKGDRGKWRLLKENHFENIFSFETVTLPDGDYYIKIKASDVRSNPAGTELSAEKISRILTIDNSLPVIKNFIVKKNKNNITVSLLAEDLFSPIAELKYFVHPGEWISIFPEDNICDSKKENFSWTFRLPQNGDNLITVKVTDSYGNTGVAQEGF